VIDTNRHDHSKANIMPMRFAARFSLVLAVSLFATIASVAQSHADASDLPPGSSQLVSPEELVKMLQASQGEKPLILNVGPSILFQQAHIPGSEYVGATAEPEGLAQLRTKIKPVGHNKTIVLYCGCCPWSRCPNVRPAYKELHNLGFNNVKVLYIANNFGTDWVDKGYPTVKGR
jgi:thiosulfate/3-mercaptopyruvate sulfurtransferase